MSSILNLNVETQKVLIETAFKTATEPSGSFETKVERFEIAFEAMFKTILTERPVERPDK